MASELVPGRRSAYSTAMVSMEQDTPRTGQTYPSSLAGRRAFVAGGSGGIGAAISRELALRGVHIIVHGRTRQKVQATVQAIRDSGGSAEGLVFDIQSTLATSSTSAFIPAVSGLGPIDVLVIAFGPFIRKSLRAHTTDDWLDMATLNLALPGALASALLPSMMDRAYGRILFLGGTRTDAIRGYLSNAAYAAAKTGLDVLTKSIALEYSAHNVAAITVCPGLVETEYLDPDSLGALKSMAPAGRLISPGEVARIAVDLMASNPCIASGAIVSLDSGFHA